MAEQYIYRAADLPAVLEWQVRDFVRIVWSDANVDDSSIPLGNPEHDPYHFVLVLGDTLISHAQVTTFSLEYADQTYRVGGLGGVLTYPKFRKGGYGSMVVAHATKHIAASGVDFGMLFTSPDRERFYNHNNWVRIPGITILKGDKSNPRIHDEIAMLYPVTQRGQQAADLFQYATIYIGAHSW